MTIEIPNQLKDENCRFVRLDRRTKRPIDKEWTKDNNFKGDSEELKKHIEEGNNIGFLCGSNDVYVIDVDDKSKFDDIFKIVGETFIVETPRGYHLYVKHPNKLRKGKLKIEGKLIGDFQAVGEQVVLAGSMNEKGNEYKIYRDVPIKEISKESLGQLMGEFPKREFIVESPNWSQYSKTPLSDKISIDSLVDKSKLKKYNDEFYGVHPVHGSTTGMNFFINPSKNLWHCFRCSSGGDALSYLSLIEGVCKCEDFSSGGKRLRGADFMKVLDVAKKKHKIKLDDVHKEFLEKVRIITDKELSELELEEIDWIIKDIIPGVSLVLIAGKTGSMKSIMTTYMAFACCYGLDFLGKFPTKNTKWLYIDEENPKRITKSRNVLIRKGLGVEPTENFGYLLHAGMKLVGNQKNEFIQTLIKFIKEFGPDVVVLDSLVRFLSAATDENKAGDISDIFTTLRQISIDNKVTFIIIHHMNKAGDKKGVDRVRGSTDIVNAVDVALLFDRDSTTPQYISISQEKNRYEKELEPFNILVESDEEKFGFSVSNRITKEQDKASKAASEITKWLEQKEWGESGKEFETSEVLENFSQHFDRKYERNRKIVQGALAKLIVWDKIERIGRGRYKMLNTETEE